MFELRLSSRKALAAQEDGSRELAENIAKKLVAAYGKQGKHDKALVVAKELAEQSSSAAALKQLADVYYDLGQYELANQQYRAIALNKSRLTKKSKQLQSLIDADNLSPRELADAWRAGYSSLKQSEDNQEEQRRARQAFS